MTRSRGPTPERSPETMSKLCVYYRNAAATPPLACTVLDVASGDLWSPSAKAYGANPSDALIPLTAVNSTLHPGAYTAVVAGVPTPATTGEVLVSVHPAAGGAPVDTPFPVAGSVTPAEAGVGVALLIG